MVDKYDLYIKALSLRKELEQDSSSPIDIFSLINTIPKLTLVFYPMGKNLSGICIKNNGYPLIAINSSMSYGRQRFSLAHELYHLYFDKTKQTTICAIKIDPSNKIEKAADQFASFFLIPPIALKEALKKIKSSSSNSIELKDIVQLEQHFGVSRHALLYRLLDEKKITAKQFEQFRQGVIYSALSLGYDDALYKPLASDRQHKTYGCYIQKAEELLNKDFISTGKYEQLLLSAFRADIVYGDELGEIELND